MAIKDWKKIGTSEWYNFHFNRKLEIMNTFYGSNLSQRIVLFVDQNRNKTIVKKYFKTKSQALKFAKAYMRKH
jgi:hypothetical protein